MNSIFYFLFFSGHLHQKCDARFILIDSNLSHTFNWNLHSEWFEGKTSYLSWSQRDYYLFSYLFLLCLLFDLFMFLNVSCFRQFQWAKSTYLAPVIMEFFNKYFIIQLTTVYGLNFLRSRLDCNEFFQKITKEENNLIIILII